jgi:hypothetical protein
MLHLSSITYSITHTTEQTTKMGDEKKPKKDKMLFELGPMEQILIILGIMAFGRPIPR